MCAVMESVVYHVPMIVVPVMGDQPDNARNVEKLNMGAGWPEPSL